jgi:hypothetical protein
MGDRHGGIGLLQARLGLRQRRRGLVPLAHGNRTIADKVAGARHIRLGLEQLRLGIRDRGDLTRNAGDARLMGLMAVGQGRDLAVEIGTCLRNPGPIDIIVDQHEQLSGLDVLEVAHQNFRDIAAHLRGDVGRPAAHQRIVRLLDPAGDRADPPELEDQRHRQDQRHDKQGNNRRFRLGRLPDRRRRGGGCSLGHRRT